MGSSPNVSSGGWAEEAGEERDSLVVAPKTSVLRGCGQTDRQTPAAGRLPEVAVLLLARPTSARS